MPFGGWFRRQKRKFRPRGDASTLSDNDQVDASITVSTASVDAPLTQASPIRAISNAQSEPESRLQSNSTPITVDKPASLPERLWDQAYDELKENEAETALVQAYEKILSCHLDDRDLESDSDVNPENIIEQGNQGARRAQMKRLVTSGLVKIKRETKIKEGLNTGVQVIMSAKEVISSAIQAIPQAALAWSGVCVALELFSNSTSATKANRDGIEYVIQRMKWYWELPEIILRENINAYSHLSTMKDELEIQLIDLYKALLLYQIKSVCSYYKNRGLVFLRDIIKLDDWDSDIKEIQKAEAIFREDIKVHQTEKINANLEQLVQQMTKEDLQCFKDLGITDPKYDKKRIEKTKGGLLEQSYRWILDNPDFQLWRDDKERRLLWIRGDPGKGKTMLLCGIANEMRKSSASSGPMSYFFCQATDQRINNANAVLWGLMFMLVDQQPVLMHHIRSKYDASGKDLFTGVNSWFAVSEIFTNMLSDPALTCAYLLIDALDECVSGREELLDLLVENLSASSRVKWIVSSRDWPEIEVRLAESDSIEKNSLSLEVNADLVSRAVDAYIEHEISKLILIKQYSTLKDQIQEQMHQKANGTFLWVSLVIKMLRDRKNAEYEGSKYILNMLNEIPSDLTGLYSLMVDHIGELDGQAPTLCQKILSIAALTSRPLSLVELRVLAGFDSDHIDDQKLERLVTKCGSFLTIRDCTVYFIHQSAKDHLIMNERTKLIIFPSGHNEVHYTIFSHSLQAMRLSLKKNIYTLPHQGSHIDEIEIPDPDPLAAIRYSCSYWIEHLCDAISHNDNALFQTCLDDNGPVSAFLHTHFLHWLEALSLLRKISDNVISIVRLQNLLKTQSPETQLLHFLQDGYRFILYFIRAINMAPLQIYSSALIFSPTQSLILRAFRNDVPSWIHRNPIVDDTWSPCLQTLEGHKYIIYCVAVSGDGKLATGSGDKTIKIYDTDTGACLRTLEVHDACIRSLSFLKNNRLASVSAGTIRIWDIAAGTCIQTLEGHGDAVTSIIALSDNRLASGSHDRTLKIWDIATGVCTQTLDNNDLVISITALSDNRMASGSRDKTVRIWDIATGRCVQKLEGHGDAVTSIIALSDNRLASGSYDRTLKIWDIATGVCIQTLEGHNRIVTSITALTDNKLASGSYDETVRIWDITSSSYIQKRKGHKGSVESVALFRDKKQVASGSEDKTVMVWNIATGECVQTLEGHSDWVRSVAFSKDGKQLASGSDDKTVMIWDTTTGECVQTLEGHSDWVRSVAFSRDGKQLASGSFDKTVMVWNIATGECVQTLEGHSDWVRSVAFSRDGKQLASGSTDKTVKIWDTDTGICTRTLHIGVATQLSFDEENESRLNTNLGITSLNPEFIINEPDIYGISETSEWVTKGSKPLLWLPSEYRPKDSVVVGSTVIIGSGSGRVLMLKFSEQD
ncbi:WD40-repeat-containing domain protein [Trichoderma evansii]